MTSIAEIPSDDIADIGDYRANSLWRLTLRRLFRQRSAIVGMSILSVLLFAAIFAPLLAPYGPYQVLIDVEEVKRREGPCIHFLGCPEERPQHIMGIDGNVRDVFSRILFGARVSLRIRLDRQHHHACDGRHIGFSLLSSGHCHCICSRTQFAERYVSYCYCIDACLCKSRSSDSFVSP